MKHKVAGYDGLYKDDDSGVIVNKSESERNRYQIAKRQAMMNLESQQEISNLKQEMGEIKDLLKQLLKK